MSGCWDQNNLENEIFDSENLNFDMSEANLCKFHYFIIQPSVD